MTSPADIEPDDKDWTHVITDGCRECGFAPVPPQQVAAMLRATAGRWASALRGPQATRRPVPTTWSALEYGCHVRDVLLLAHMRMSLMLQEDDPTFENWDQDDTAVAQDYFHQDPAVVLPALDDELGRTVSLLGAVRDEQWERPGRRSNGTRFTVGSFAVYVLHDVVHHLHDVGA